MQTFQTQKCLHHDLSFAPDGRRLMVGAYTRVLIDTLGTDPPVELDPPTGLFTAHANLALGGTALVYVANARDIQVWNFASGHVATWPDAGQDVKDLAVSPDGATLYAAHITTSGFDWHTQLRAFDVATGRLKATFGAAYGHFSWLSMSADGTRLAGRGSFDVCLWDLTQPDNPDASFSEGIGGVGKPLGCVALSADGTNLVTLNNRGVTLWAVAADKLVEVFRSGKHKRRPTAAACSPAGPLVATGDNAGQIFLWDHAGRVLRRYDWGLGEVNAMCFSPDGLRCAAADDKGELVVWDIDV